MISYISSFQNNSSIPEPKVLFWIAAFIADSTVLNSHATKTLLANGLNTFFIYDKLTDINSLRKFKNPLL